MTESEDKPWAGGGWERIEVKGPPRWRGWVTPPLIALFVLALVLPFAWAAWGLWLADKDWEDAKAQLYELDMMIGMTPGTCVDEHGESIRRATCSEEHDGEITAVVPLGSGDYPGDKRVRESSAKLCQRATEDWVEGGLGEELDLELGYYYPTPEGWVAGNTSAYCYALVPRNEKLQSPLSRGA